MPASSKIDLFRDFKSEYTASRKPQFVATTPGHYLTVEGDGPPGGTAFEDAISVLYPVAYTTKFRRKLGGGPDYAVGKLECRWLGLPKSRQATTGWRWQLLMRVPDFIGSSDLQASIAALLEKKKTETVKLVEFSVLDEGRCVQMLHVGPYDEEPASFAAMEAFAAAADWRAAGAPHEIYLSDPRRVEPARLKTILRLPLEKAA